MKTIPEDQVDMVIVGLRLLQVRLGVGDLDEKLMHLLEQGGGTLPDDAEIDTLCERLDAP